MQTRPDRVYCYATNAPFRVILKESQSFTHGEVFDAIGPEITTNFVETVPTLMGATVKRVGNTNPPPPLRVTPGELLKGDLNFYRVAIKGKVLSHEWMYFQNRHIEVVVLQGSDRSFRLNILKDFSRARERLPVGTEVDVIGLSFLEVFAPPRGPEVQVDVENLNECVILRKAPWLTLEVARRLVMTGGLLVVIGLMWFVRERRQIGRLEKRIQERTAALADANEQLKKNAESMRQSEAKFRTLFESGSTAVVLHDGNKIVDCNPAWLSMLGYARREKVVGKSLLEFSPAKQPNGEDSREAIVRHNSAAFDKGRHDFEWVARKSDGSSLPVEIVLTQVHLNGQAVLQALIHDITSRKRTEEKAHRSEAVTRSINYFASSLLERDSEEEILWDLSKNCVSTLGFVDCVIYLLEPETKQLVQRAAHGPKNPADRKILNPIVLRPGDGIVGAVAKSGRAEIICDTRKDSRYIVDDAQRLSEIAVPIVANGQVIGVIDSEHPTENFFTQEHLEILESIASLCANKLVRVRAEENLRRLNIELEQRVADRTGELAAANAQLKQAEQELLKALTQEKELGELKSRFISMVSHEFRTPLAIIMSSAEILEAYLDRLEPEERASNIKDIFDATRHMGSMVDEVLLLSRVEAGKLSYKPAPLNLKSLCERLVDEITSATNRRCPIALNVHDDIPEAQADEALLRHIFMNLLDNAVKYSRPGSTVEFGLEIRDEMARFTVRDRGVGISQLDIRQLFQAFHRGQNVGETPGTGLGLVIVKYCVELHHGKIGVESIEGEGSTFTVALPVFKNCTTLAPNARNAISQPV